MMKLERLGRCPVCRGPGRKPAYERVTDGVFGVKGEWDYWACDCGILYLDPRPHPDSMAEAYAGYYTHSTSEAPLKWREAGFRGAIRRGYLNARYGYRFPDASRLGGLTWPLRRRAVRNLDFMIRHLPAPRREGSRVLDVGCGNGDFLAVAGDLGYRASGIDPDPMAVGRARARGLDARCAPLPGSGESPGSFDHLFLNHVLEHLADPIAALDEARSLLVPGGRLWLSLPNLGAEGLRRFGRHWRGLEPPRHFALFDAPSLTRMLEGSGFDRVRLLPPEDAAPSYFRQSQAISQGLDPAAAADPPGWDSLRGAAAAARRLVRSSPEKAESLTMIAWAGRR